jgi:hypothetical protein
MRVPTTIAATVAACLLMGVACGDDDDSDSSASGSGDVCDTLEGFDSTVDAITGTGGDSDADETVADVQSAIDQFQSDLEEVRNQDSDLPSGLESALDSAASALESVVSELPSEETLAEAGDAVASAQSSLATAWTNLLDELNCSSS